tara:strand:- start:5321 stop:6382 length:1062 start_codon:yes stop_codon:yes gene_type:complete
MLQSNTLVIGDCHFHNPYPAIDYIKQQFDVINRIVKLECPKHIIFLGDVFHYRKPDPEIILEVVSFFNKLCLLTPGLKAIYVIRGNHDTASKSDTETKTILDVLDFKFTKNKVHVINDTDGVQLDNLDFQMIPHYDKESYILKELALYDTSLVPPDVKKFVFGHFGFKGCINTAGDEDSKLTIDAFKYPTFLGHIHKPQDEGHVHVVGTPYSTSFSESDNNHRYAIIHDDGTYEFKPIKFGLRYLSFSIDALEANKDLINDPKYFTLLRVFINQITDQNSVDLRKQILKDYNVKWVDIKFLPMIDEEGEQSAYRPKSMVFEVDDQLIDSYVSEARSEIPKAQLLDGLKMLKVK